jgi:hypothetical protein
VTEDEYWEELREQDAYEQQQELSMAEGNQQNNILPELTIAEFDKLMRQPGTSYSVALGWSIAWVGNGWQVFYNAIDAYYRLTNKDGEGKSLTWASFRRAWDWVRELSATEVHRITVESVSGVKQ